MPETENIELQWIKEFQQGNIEVFNHLLKRYKKPLIHFVYRFLGNQDEAEDAAQDILVKVYRALPAYKPSGNLSTWIFTIAQRHCSNINRKKRLLSIFSLDELLSQKKESAISPSFSKEINPESNTTRNIMQEEIQQSLLRLPEKQRTAILLSKFENRSHEEIAEILHVSLGSVKQLIFRAKIDLRARLKKYI